MQGRSQKEVSREAARVAQNSLINFMRLANLFIFSVSLFLRAVKLYSLRCRAVSNQWTGMEWTASYYVLISALTIISTFM